MFELIQEYLKKNAAIFGAIGGVGGFIGDVLAPLANFSFILLIASAIGVGVTAGFYLYFDRDHKVTLREKALTKLVFFGTFTLIWAFFSFIHVVGPEQGVAASAIPGIEKLQESIGIIEKDVAEIKETTKAIKGDTEEILAEIQDIKGDLEAAQRGGQIIAKPKTAPDYYGNAYLYAARGETEKAIESYQGFFEFGYPYLDIYAGFNILAKNGMTKGELKEFYDGLAADQPNNIVAHLMVGSLIKDHDDRRAYYSDLRAEKGDSSALLYWLINEYSVIGTYLYANELSASEQQGWSSGDTAILGEVVRDFKALPPNDTLEPYFINSFSYDGAKSIINAFANQFEDETLTNLLDNPLTLSINPTGTANESEITFVVYDDVSDIFYRIPGTVDNFTSTPQEPSTSPFDGGATIPETRVTLSIPSGNHTVEAYWINGNGKKSDVYTFTDAPFLSFQQWSALDEKPLVLPDKP